MQQALYRRLAVGVMGIAFLFIAFLLKYYQTVPIYKNGGAGIGITKAL